MAAVEVSVPHGAFWSYALLGAELMPADVDGLDVVVSVCGTGASFRSSLAPTSTEIQLGMPGEYASAVIAGVLREGEDGGAPTGASLRFRWAAHHPVGSSRSIFQAAGEIVARLLLMPLPASEQQCRTIIVDRLARRGG